MPTKGARLGRRRKAAEGGAALFAIPRHDCRTSFSCTPSHCASNCRHACYSCRQFDPILQRVDTSCRHISSCADNARPHDDVPSVRALPLKRCTRNLGQESAGRRARRSIAIHTSWGSCVPISWKLSANTRQMIAFGTAATTSARPWCSAGARRDRAVLATTRSHARHITPRTRSSSASPGCRSAPRTDRRIWDLSARPAIPACSRTPHDPGRRAS